MSPSAHLRARSRENLRKSRLKRFHTFHTLHMIPFDFLLSENFSFAFLKFFLKNYTLDCSHPVLIQKTAVWRIREEAGVPQFTRFSFYIWNILTCSLMFKFFNLRLFPNLFFSEIISWVAATQFLIWILISMVAFEQLYFLSYSVQPFFAIFALLKISRINWTVLSVGNETMSYFTSVAGVCEAQLRLCFKKCRIKNMQLNFRRCREQFARFSIPANWKWKKQYSQ